MIAVGRGHKPPTALGLAEIVANITAICDEFEQRAITIQIITPGRRSKPPHKTVQLSGARCTEGFQSRATLAIDKQGPAK